MATESARGPSGDTVPGVRDRGDSRSAPRTGKMEFSFSDKGEEQEGQHLGRFSDVTFVIPNGRPPTRSQWLFVGNSKIQ